MNTITIVVTLLVFWLVMGLGFLSEYTHCRRQGASLLTALGTWPGILFVSSVVIPLFLFITDLI